MPKNKLTDYSATNASNTDVGGINIDEGMLPSDVNNAIREVMTHLKDFSEGTQPINALDVAGTITSDGLTVDTADGSLQVSSGFVVDLTRAGTNYIRASDASGGLRLGSGSGYNRLDVASNGDISFYDSTGVTQGLFWDASTQSLGLGTTSPAVSLQIKASSPAVSLQAFASKTSGSRADFNAYNSDVSTVGYIRFGAVTDNVGTDIQFANRPAGGSLTERLRITSDGSVGIGVSSPASRIDGRLSGTSSGEILSVGNTGSGVFGGIAISDGGTYPVRHWGSSLEFYTGSSIYSSATEAARLDASGSLLVGKTAADSIGTDGIEIDGPNGRVIITRDNSEPLILNRKTSDGDIAVFRKDSTQVGSIGTNSSTQFFIGGSGGGADAGLAFYSAGTIPTSGNGTASDGGRDLGASSVRFRDLYLSGTANAAGLSVDGGTIKLDGNYPTGTNNVALGDAALNGSMSGSYNVAVGQSSLVSLTSGSYNSAFGQGTLASNTSGSSNVSVGTNSLLNNTTASNNTAVGYQAAYSNTTGTNLTALGYSAAKYSTANHNTAIGTESLLNTTTGESNTGLGFASLYSNTTGANNTSVGRGALQSNTTASNNTAVGYQAGYLNTTGTENSVFGYQALYSNTTGNYLTAIGYGSLVSNTTGSNNVAIGRQALLSNTTASNNTAVGYQAGFNNTTGTENAGFGAFALYANTTAIYNTALGYATLQGTTTGSYNTGVGRAALQANTTGIYNTALGYDALYSSTTASSNTALGQGAGRSTTTGAGNTFIGRDSGYYVTTGSNNTILGRYTGNQGGLDIRTSSNNIVLADGDGNPRGYYTSDQWFFNSPRGGGSAASTFNFRCSGVNPQGLRIEFTGAADDDSNEDFFRCIDTATTRLIINNQGDVQNHDNSYGAISDVKLKEQITDASSQWDDIKALTVRKYKMKLDVTEKGDSDDLWRLGVVAQEVETAGMSGLITENIDRDEDGNDLGTRTKVVKYSILYMKAVKALQEAMDRIETLEAKVAALESN